MFIAIEGLDGAGKATQSRLLSDYLEKQGHTTTTVAFPRYGEPSAALAENYLQGKLGSSDNNPPHVASLYYAIDRFHAARNIKQDLHSGNWVIADRWVASNLAHQGQKIGDTNERRAFFNWGSDLEYNLLELPKPDYSIILFFDPEQARQLAAQEDKSGTGVDMHDKDPKHSQKTAVVYQELLETLPQEFQAIECFENGKLLPPEEIHEKIKNLIKI